MGFGVNVAVKKKKKKTFIFGPADLGDLEHNCSSLSFKCKTAIVT